MTVRPFVTAMVVVTFASAPAPAYEDASVPDGGVLTGTVRFAGPPPALAPIAVTKHRDVCGERQLAEALVVGADRGVQGSVVMIEGVSRGKKNTAELTLDTHRCAFVPHVAAVMVGTRARVKNSDPVLHNPRGFVGRPAVFNLAVPNKDQVIDITRRLSTPGVVRLLCDAHPHMSGWLVVHDSPYVTATDERGAFRIAGIPSGTYRVTMWHEGFRPKGTDTDGRPLYGAPVTVTREITIPSRATATADFEIR